MKVYISGPMTGIPEWNFPAFNKSAEYLRASGLDVVNPAELNGANTDWHACLRNDLKALCDCDALVLLPGWQHSKGAMFELEVAHSGSGDIAVKRYYHAYSNTLAAWAVYGGTFGVAQPALAAGPFETEVEAQRECLRLGKEEEFAEILALIRGEGQFAHLGGSITTHPDSEDESKLYLHEACLTLHQRGLIRQHCASVVAGRTSMVWKAVDVPAQPHTAAR